MDIEIVLAESEIRNLAYRFADAVNRGDARDLAALWAADATWVIDAPMNVEAVGVAAISALFDRLMAGWRFFHQAPQMGPITLSGTSATARVYWHEIGIFKDERTHRNWGEYLDSYAKVDGLWLYTRRHYRFLYVDGPEMRPDLLGMAIGSDEA